VGDALRPDVRGLQRFLCHRGKLHAAGGRHRGGEHHVHRGAGTDAGNRRAARRRRHARRHHAAVLRRGADDRSAGRDARAAAVAGARCRPGRLAHQGIRRRPDHFRHGADGDARPARGGRLCRGPDAGPARGRARPGGSTAHLAMFYILLQEFIGDLRVQRTRAFLTFFAVTWGTLAVVLLLACGEGLTRTVRDGLPLTVVGVLKRKLLDPINTGADADRGVIPYSTSSTIYGNRVVNHLIVQPRDASRGPLVKAELYRVLGRKYRFDPTDERALGMWDFIESEKETLAVGLGIQVFMGLVGAFTLLIAGVGVANIMYVVVKERTQEIGVKLALGARRRHIMAQFLFEAMTIAVSGGLVGLATAALIVLGVDAIPTEDNPAMQYILNA